VTLRLKAAQEFRISSGFLSEGDSARPSWRLKHCLLATVKFTFAVIPGAASTPDCQHRSSRCDHDVRRGSAATRASRRARARAGGRQFEVKRISAISAKRLSGNASTPVDLAFDIAPKWLLCQAITCIFVVIGDETGEALGNWRHRLSDVHAALDDDAVYRRHDACIAQIHIRHRGFGAGLLHVGGSLILLGQRGANATGLLTWLQLA
jgi:hypothetical protein